MKSKQKINQRKEAEKAALAAKLDALNPPPPPSGKPFYADFDSYVRDYPDGERYRAWLTNRGKHQVVMLLMSRVNGAMHGGMPGHYLAVSLSEHPDWPDKTKQVVQLSLHDCDDGLAVRRWPAEQRAEAEKTLAEMMALAPFTMWECAEHFGLKFE